MVLSGSQSTLLFHPGDCFWCWDTAISRTKHGGLMRCGECSITDEEMSPAARRLFECVFARVEKKLDVDDQVLLTAKILIRATIDRPISNAVLQGQLRASEREVKAAVRTLRREWELPVGSNRQPPSGYYWMSNAAEFIEWARAYRSQAIDELVTLYRLQRANYNELAGQTPLQFTEQLHQEIEEALS